MAILGVALAIDSPCLVGCEYAGGGRASAATTLQGQETDPTVPRYRPGMHQPKSRIEGTTRGIESSELLVLPLVPDHVGLTIASQPVLYWYLSKPTTSPIIFVLVDTHSVEVVHDVTLSPQPQPGVQLVRLTDLGIVLEPNVQYRWYITVVIDGKSPSRDIVSGGMIERIRPEFILSHVPAPDSTIAAVRFYAENGLWYDALASISDLIASAPDDRRLRRQRAALLQQVGLQEAAEWDLRQVGTE
ncbi:MAG: DUF928 domain-containing protein [Nitrospirota bacterium]|nr:DUF928 domain-containing protein [Nitrospirota bacterium]